MTVALTLATPRSSCTRSSRWRKITQSFRGELACTEAHGTTDLLLMSTCAGGAHVGGDPDAGRSAADIGVLDFDSTKGSAARDLGIAHTVRCRRDWGNAVRSC